MKTISRSGLFAIAFMTTLGLGTASVIAQDTSAAAAGSNADASTQYTSQVEQRGISLALATIRSPNDLNAYLKGIPDSLSPLGKLSPVGKSRFLNSITFNEKGITGYSYSDLRSELTVSQIYQVLVLFGVQSDAALIPGTMIKTNTDRLMIQNPSPAVDHMNYACVGRGTCRVAFDSICTSNC